MKFLVSFWRDFDGCYAAAKVVALRPIYASVSFTLYFSLLCMCLTVSVCFSSWLSVYLSVCVWLYLYVDINVCFSSFLPIHLRICLPVYLSIYLCVYLFLYFFMYPFVSSITFLCMPLYCILSFIYMKYFTLSLYIFTFSKMSCKLNLQERDLAETKL